MKTTHCSFGGKQKWTKIWRIILNVPAIQVVFAQSGWLFHSIQLNIAGDAILFFWPSPPGPKTDQTLLVYELHYIKIAKNKINNLTTIFCLDPTMPTIKTLIVQCQQRGWWWQQWLWGHWEHHCVWDGQFCLPQWRGEPTTPLPAGPPLDWRWKPTTFAFTSQHKQPCTSWHQQWWTRRADGWRNYQHKAKA